jgi:hypothetical protein
MNKFIPLAAAGLVALGCATLIVAQQDSAPQQTQASSNEEAVQNFLKSYGSRPSEPEAPATQPAAGEEQGAATEQPQPPQDVTPPSQQQQSPQAAAPSEPQTQPIFSNEPYKPIQDKSIWKRLQVPPTNIHNEAEQQQREAQQNGTSNQPQSTPGAQQSTTQTQTTEQGKSQTTPDHYNIFQ